MEIGQDIQLNLINEKSQNEFLNSTLWKTINNGIDLEIFKPKKDETIYDKYNIPKAKKVILGVANWNHLLK